MKILKYALLFLFTSLILLIIFGVSKCKYEEISDRVTTGSGYGFSIDDSFSSAIGGLKKIPEEYPNSLLHVMHAQESSSSTVPWGAIDELHPSERLFIIYDTNSNYLDFLDISFKNNKVFEIERGKFCALNPTFKQSHRLIADLLGIDY